MAKVSVVKCKRYEDAKEAIKKGLDLIRLAKFIKKGDKVLIKPNICDPFPPEKASCTHPLFVKAVIELVQKQGAEAWVGEASGGIDIENTGKALRISGILDAIEETRAVVRNFQKEPFIPKDIENYGVLEKTDFASAVFEADKIINLPKLKTHGLVFMTGAIKNCLGCIHPGERQYLHRQFPKVEEFAEGLADVFSVVKPSLTIMDAVVAMEGDEGPSHGNPKNVGLVIASEDAVAVDAVAAEIIGYKALAIPTTKIAAERGLGNIKNIKVIGEKLKNVLVKDFKKSSLFAELNKYKKEGGHGKEFFYNPVLIKERCIKCGTCEKNCPVGAISLKPYPEIDRKKCIRCYCCHELCPQTAYSLEKAWLVNIFAPYRKGNKFILRDREIKGEFLIVKFGNLPKINSKNAILSFELSEKDLNRQTGKKIIKFLENLKLKGIEFSVARALPRCLFEDSQVYEKFAIPKNCFECGELFSVNGGTKGCFALKGKAGPKLKHMQNREQAHEYFENFLEQLKLNNTCRNCLYQLRRQCNGLCFRE